MALKVAPTFIVHWIFRCREILTRTALLLRRSVRDDEQILLHFSALLLLPSVALRKPIVRAALI